LTNPFKPPADKVSDKIKTNLFDNPFVQAKVEKPAYLAKQEESSSPEISPNTSPVEPSKVILGGNKLF
jgi:hypothetical protein